jgi:hypothetical protein
MSGLPAQLPWRRFVCVLHKLGYSPQKTRAGFGEGVLQSTRQPTTVSFREPHPGTTLRQATLHNYIRKLMLTSDEFMELLKEC